MRCNIRRMWLGRGGYWEDSTFRVTRSRVGRAQNSASVHGPCGRLQRIASTRHWLTRDPFVSGGGVPGREIGCQSERTSDPKASNPTSITIAQNRYTLLESILVEG